MSSDWEDNCTTKYGVDSSDYVDEDDFLSARASSIASEGESFGIAGDKDTQQGGCYIATCVYGSYDCPQVWRLRRFRDCTLADTAAGRAFIRFYYAVSPKLVALLGEKNWFRKSWLKALNPLDEHLARKGFSNAPYSDTH